MGTVSGTKGVVHINVGEAGELLSEGGIILFFFREEAHVLEQNHIAVGHGVHLGFGVRSDAAVGFGHRLAEQLA